MSELRWDPLRREWIITATHRMERTFLPPRDYCPLCPTEPGGFATEIPRPDFEIAVFENRFPSLHRQPPAPGVQERPLNPVLPAEGICEVVVYSADHEGDLGTLPPERVEMLIRVWRDRYRELGRRENIRYVLIFENRGAEVGVTLHHPHGQIYAFPFIPPVPARELQSAREHRAQTGRCLYCDLLAAELEEGRRLVSVNEAFAAFVPFTARYPYEVHLYARRHLVSLEELSPREISLLAGMLQRLVRSYDRLFDLPFPYIMVLHQEPTGLREGLGHLHFEFLPPLRDRGKLKFLAGCEQGAGTFINDSMPEEKAILLRAAWDKEDQSC
ncbi:MAG TPA: galactose-1-phosphate uridylyltransferase [Bacillota bacterium]|nr:galactose-1-phosphate uridylyltransferase [Bacillota bacterium]HOB87179.1 galactose-1-phosphate uridylyltransferase [Bacillota bacterium]HOP69324.1 galactose-1-phosphate uridylyltransferase [Bacillota bacterium]HPT34724.1 galactose-1-phosphate uridylyltransferase [Bacillota bacterium]HQD06185.1 galactose-1-phosphate uridylyltransferase [Bacillota bacterium]